MTGTKSASGSREHYHYGKVYLERGEPENAIEQFRIALESEPDSPNVLIGLGRAHLALKDFDESIRMLEKAVRIAGEFADAHFFLGMAHLESGRKEKAINEFKEALNINPRYTAAKKRLDALMGTERAGGRPDREKEKLAEEEERTSRQANVHFHLGNALFQKNMLQEAYVEYKQAVRLRPNFPDIRNRLGELHMKRGDFDLAEEEFVEALKVNPRYLAAILNLAETRLRHSESLQEKAESDFIRAQEIDPGNERARRGLEKIRAVKNIDYL